MSKPKNSSLPHKVHSNYGEAKASELTKTEYATIHFIAAHLTAHGKYPEPEQIAALVDLAKYSLFRVSLDFENDRDRVPAILQEIDDRSVGQNPLL